MAEEENSQVAHKRRLHKGRGREARLGQGKEGGRGAHAGGREGGFLSLSVDPDALLSKHRLRLPHGFEKALTRSRLAAEGLL